MTKSYPEQLDQWIQHQPRARRDRNRVAFLAVRPDVDAALNAGYAIKTVWTNLYLGNRIHFGYDTFLKYVHRYCRPRTVQPAAPPCADLTALASTSKQALLPDAMHSIAPKTRSPPTQTGFIFDAIPNKEELL